MQRGLSQATLLAMTHGNARTGEIATWTDVLIPVAALARRRFRDPGPGHAGRTPVRWTNVDPKIAPHTEGEAEWVASQRKWTCGWRRLVLLAIPLVYLTYVADAIGQNSHGAAAAAGYAVLAAFGRLLARYAAGASGGGERVAVLGLVRGPGGTVPGGVALRARRCVRHVRLHHDRDRGPAGRPFRTYRGRAGTWGAACPGRDRILARQSGRCVRHGHPGCDPDRRALGIRGAARRAREPGPRRGPRRAGSARRGKRADPDRP